MELVPLTELIPQCSTSRNRMTDQDDSIINFFKISTRKMSCKCVGNFIDLLYLYTFLNVYCTKQYDHRKRNILKEKVYI
jgi:hypothetical protein